MNIEDIKDLIIAIDKTTIEKVEIEKNDFKIMISKKANSEAFIPKSIMGESENSGISARITDGNIREFENEINEVEYDTSLIDDENIFIVKSPIVGTFFKAPGPDSPPFVNVGDMVEKGQTLCIIEAMKIMNEIECERGGQITDIFIEDEGIVEFGQPLMLIRR
ncbi:MAG TPA: acetyl-CoA carboxylase biotin carboxyl carrier protein [Clostridia bacterium]|nr:acetyl-CoA carboxylase biotin carboxyl carrier protein [Clostridia bacterium]